MNTYHPKPFFVFLILFFSLPLCGEEIDLYESFCNNEPYYSCQLTTVKFPDNSRNNLSLFEEIYKKKDNLAKLDTDHKSIFCTFYQKAKIGYSGFNFKDEKNTRRFFNSFSQDLIAKNENYQTVCKTFKNGTTKNTIDSVAVSQRLAEMKKENQVLGNFIDYRRKLLQKEASFIEIINSYLASIVITIMFITLLGLLFYIFYIKDQAYIKSLRRILKQLSGNHYNYSYESIEDIHENIIFKIKELQKDYSPLSQQALQQGNNQKYILETLQHQFNQLNADYNQLNASYKNLQSENNELRPNYARVTKQFQEVSAEKAELQKKITAQKGEIQLLEDNIALFLRTWAKDLPPILKESSDFDVDIALFFFKKNASKPNEVAELLQLITKLPIETEERNIISDALGEIGERLFSLVNTDSKPDYFVIRKVGEILTRKLNGLIMIQIPNIDDVFNPQSMTRRDNAVVQKVQKIYSWAIYSHGKQDYKYWRQSIVS